MDDRGKEEKNMSGLFINYRREDTAPYAGRLYDHLRRSFPNSKVFMDIDAIDPGEDFVNAINETLSASKVVIAVIGPRWEKVTDGSGARRIDNPDDYVVRELSAALEGNARVIPVLVGGATMPRTDGLPTCLQSLARRHAIEVSDTRFVADAERLSAAISRAIAPPGSQPPEKAGMLRESSGEDFAIGDSMTTFKTLLWTSYALAILAFLIQLVRGTGGDPFGQLVISVLLLGFAAWFNIMLIRGKNWARMAFLALSVLTLPVVLFEWSTQSGVEIAVNLISIALAIWLVRMMFTDPIRGIFRKT
jgi:TIR domain